MADKSQQATVNKASGTTRQLGCKEKVYSYSQVCTFMVKRCLITDKSDSGCREDELYRIYQAYCVIKNSMPLASKNAFREIANNMGFKVFQDTDGTFYYRGLFFKPNFTDYLQEVRMNGALD